MKKDEQTGLIYAHHNLINDKYYIGQTIKPDPTIRWHQDGSGYRSQQKFWAAIQKYGWENFEHIILELDIPISQLGEHEEYWIQCFDAINNGYNVAHGTNSLPMTEEMKARISEGWSQEQRQKQSERMKARWQYNRKEMEKSLEAMHAAPRPDFSGANNPMYGTHRTGKDAARKRAVECIETGYQFHTIIEAARWAGSESLKSHISAVCKGTRKTAGKDPLTLEPLHWKYIEEVTNPYE